MSGRRLPDYSSVLIDVNLVLQWRIRRRIMKSTVKAHRQIEDEIIHIARAPHLVCGLHPRHLLAVMLGVSDACRKA